MFKRRSTLDPIQKQKKTKQTQYYSILQTCMQIPNDDKLIVRKLILNEEDHLIDMLQKYKKSKNLRQLQILLRKYIQNYKNNQTTNLVNLYKSTSKHNLLLNQQKSFKKIVTMSSLHGSLVQSPKKQNANQCMTKNLTKKTLVDLDSIQWQKRIQNQIQKQIQTNMNQKQQEFQNEENYEISFMQDESSLINIQQISKKILFEKQQIAQKSKSTQKQIIKNFLKKRQLKEEIKKSQNKEKQNIQKKEKQNKEKQIAQIDINISWKKQNEQISNIKQSQTVKTSQTQTNDQQFQLTLKQIKFDSNIINNDHLSHKSYPTMNQFSPQIRTSDCYASQIKQFVQNTNAIHKGQSTIRSSIRSSMKYQPNINAYPTRRNTLVDKQNIIKKGFFSQIDQNMPKYKQKRLNQLNFQYCNQFTKNLKSYSKQNSLQSLSQQKCKITNSTVTYRPQMKMDRKNLEQITCLTSKKYISPNNRLLYYEKESENKSQQQKFFILSNRTKLLDSAQKKIKYYQENLNQNKFKIENCGSIRNSQVYQTQMHKSDIKKYSKSKQMDFYKRIQMTINGQMD